MMSSKDKNTMNSNLSSEGERERDLIKRYQLRSCGVEYITGVALIMIVFLILRGLLF